MIKVGIVGLGGMGTVHYNNYLKINGCQVVALVSNSPLGKKKAEKWKIPVYKDISSMVQQEEIHVIDICTPTFLHKEQVMEALSYGKHVIVEKPMALHKEDAMEMFESAKDKGLLLLVGQVLQFTKEAEILHEIVKSEAYGKPLDGYFERITACPRWVQGGWLFDKEKSGLLPFDLHIHDLDLIISLFGRPRNYSFTSCGGRDKTYKEQYRFQYKYEGLHMVGEAAWYNAHYPFTARWRVYFEKALLVNDGNSLVLYLPEKEPYFYDVEDPVKIPTGINLPPTGMFYRELSHFIDCIQKGVYSDKITQQQIMDAIEILEEILKGE